MQIETEVKIKCPDYKSIEKKVKKLGAKYLGIKQQIDIYYSPEKGPKFVYPHPYKFRLRFNKNKNETRLEFHKSISELAAKEYEVDVSDFITMKKILEFLKFRINATIDKKRIEYKYKKFNITFDIVKGLGNFMEIELIGGNSKENEKKIYKFLDELDIEKDMVDNGRYLDMLLKRKMIKKK